MAPADATVEGVRVSSRRRVLVVDDERHFRRAAARILVLDGWVVEEASDVTAALERLRRPDGERWIALVDDRMPGGSGIDLVRTIGADPDLAHRVLCVVCSASARPEDAAAAGALACLRKPVADRALLDAIQGCEAPIRRRAGP